jgi:uncharacterized protein
MSFTEIALIMLSVCFASTIKSAFGFGDNLVNMAILTLFIPLNTAAPFVSATALSTSIFISLKDKQSIDFGNVKILILSAVIFIPVGIYLAEITDTNIMKKILGMLISAFSIFSLITPNLGTIKNLLWTWFFGALAGIFAGAYNIPGPPTVIYGTMKGWPPTVFRASIQAIFIVTASAVMFSHLLKGNLNQQILELYLYALPFLAIGIFTGKWLNRKIKNPDIFRKLIYLILLIIGLTLIFNH